MFIVEAVFLLRKSIRLWSSQLNVNRFSAAAIQRKKCSLFVEHFDFADCGQPQMAIGQGHPDALAQYTARFSATHVDIVGCVLNVCVLILVLIYWYLTAKCRSSLTSFCSKCQNLSIIDRRQLQQMCIVFNFSMFLPNVERAPNSIHFVLSLHDIHTYSAIRWEYCRKMKRWKVAKTAAAQDETMMLIGLTSSYSHHSSTPVITKSNCNPAPGTAAGA